jgi:hypothetical protein
MIILPNRGKPKPGLIKRDGMCCEDPKVGLISK